MSASVIAILFAAAITPGPNNLVVMDAARRGLRAALAPISGTVLGTLGLVLTVRFGLDAVIETYEKADTVLRILGAALLGYIGLRMLISGWSPHVGTKQQGIKQAFFAPMLILQLVNPKTWLMATAVAAAHTTQASTSAIQLAALTVAVPAACLFVWAVAGKQLGGFLEQPPARQIFASAMALSLAGFAALLLFNGSH